MNALTKSYRVKSSPVRSRPLPGYRVKKIVPYEGDPSRCYDDTTGHPAPCPGGGEDQPQQQGPTQQGVPEQRQSGAEAAPAQPQEQAPQTPEAKKAKKKIQPVKDALVAAAKAGRAVGGAYGAAGRAVAYGAYKVSEKVAEKINKTRGKKEGDKGYVEAHDVWTKILTSPLAVISDWFGGSAQDQAEDAARDEAERSTGVPMAYSIMKILFAAGGWMAVQLQKKANEYGLAPKPGEEEPKEAPPEQEQQPQQKSLLVSPFRARIGMKAFKLSQSGKRCFDDSSGKLVRTAMSNCTGQVSPQPSAPANVQSPAQTQQEKPVAKKTGRAADDVRKGYESLRAELRDISVEEMRPRFAQVVGGADKAALAEVLRGMDYPTAGMSKRDMLILMLDNLTSIKMSHDQTAQIGGEAEKPAAKKKPAEKPKQRKPAKSPVDKASEAIDRIKDSTADLPMDRIAEKVGAAMRGMSADQRRKLLAKLGYETEGLTDRQVREGVILDVVSQKRHQAEELLKQHGRTNPKLKHIDERIAPLAAAVQGDEVAFAAYLDSLEEGGVEVDREAMGRRVKQAGTAQAAATLTAEMAAGIMRKQDDDFKASFRRFVERAGMLGGSPDEMYSGANFEAWVRSRDYRLHRGRGHTLDWENRDHYTLGKLIESLGYQPAWENTPPGFESIKRPGWEQIGGGHSITEHEIGPTWHPCTPREGGVATAYDERNPTRLHTAVAPNKAAFDTLFVRLHQLRDGNKGGAIPSGKLASWLRETKQGREASMSDIWGAIKYATSRGMLVVRTDGKDSQPATGERSDSGVMWESGKPALIGFPDNPADEQVWDSYRIGSQS